MLDFLIGLLVGGSARSAETAANRRAKVRATLLLILIAALVLGLLVI